MLHVEKAIPLKQGLKLIHVVVASAIKTVEKAIPLKQGLKLRNIIKHENRHPGVEKAIPLKQGLKHEYRVGLTDIVKGRKGNSIKTRIETTYIRDRRRSEQ